VPEQLAQPSLGHFELAGQFALEDLGESGRTRILRVEDRVVQVLHPLDVILVVQQPAGRVVPLAVLQHEGRVVQLPVHDRLVLWEPGVVPHRQAFHEVSLVLV